MFWYYLRNKLYFFFRTFFKRLGVKNADRIRVNNPMLVTMNHPNSFMDTIAISAALFYPRTYYMARGDAFKPGLITTILKAIGIVPIYRLRDGGGHSSVKKNLASFKVVYDLLNKRQKIIVLAEGISLQERRLQPIQKGTAKMAFSYLEQGGHQDLKILPIGVNYSTPSKFRGDVYYQIGEPILVKDFYDDYIKQPAQTIIKLTNLIEERMKPLVPSLINKENDVVIEQLQPILKKQYIVEHNLNYNNLEQQQQYWEYIIAKLNNLTEKQAENMVNFRIQVANYTKQLQQLKLRDHLIYNAGKKNRLTVFNFIVLIIGFPFYMVGKILNFIPYYYGKRVADKTCKDIEFHAAVNFGVGTFIWMVTFLIELLVIGLLTKSWCMLLIYTVVKAGFGRIGLSYSPFKKKMLGALRLNKIKKTDTTLFKSLQQQRQQIVNFINQ
ncbi:MAG TPA: 1-acyl-sn-glycerol-3-phosphate acyltransferase [Bacteroidia bacterium]|nr:1-acyl-sn-glycerol-3-phosphate acyltransferase [Bacteroidia bacterium]